jgi:hypothetical protein
MPRILPSAAAALMLVAGNALAQERPNFTGTWLMDMTRSESPAQQSDSSPRKPVTLVVAQRPTDLTIETRTDDKNQALTYKLTSTTADQETAPIGTVGSADSVQSAIMRWDGPRLTIRCPDPGACAQLGCLRLTLHGPHRSLSLPNVTE